ncbi:MAG: response regulator transcription factor [Lachnospiraceae bacterium]|nr:response regulator transcription factor [Lachnospiraceae bacterium]
MQALKSSGYEVRDFECASVFYSCMKEQLPSLILLDTILPDRGGLDIVRELRSNARTHRLPIILVASHSTELDRVRGLDSGADDYITKPFGVMEMLSRVKALIRRSRNTNEERFFREGPIFVNDEKREAFISNAPMTLTYKEYEILKLFLINAGAVVPREQIVQRVWGADFEKNSRTLDIHIRSLRRKLGNAGTMIRTVRRVGYILDGKLQ